MEVYTVKSAKREFDLRSADEVEDMQRLVEMEFVFGVDCSIARVMEEPIICIDEDSKFLATIAILGGEVVVSLRDRTITVCNDNW